MTGPYFHGGVPGLRPGALILPPTVTGAGSTADYLDAGTEVAEAARRVYRPDRVYLTTDVEVARMWAGLHPSGTDRRGGDVYRVEPVGKVEPDPDYRGGDGASVCCPSARVSGIVATGVGRAKYRPLFQLLARDAL